MSTRRRLPLVAAAVVALAAAIASLLPLPARADAQMARAEEIVSGKCFICHGMEGESSSPVFPRLTGQNAAYVARQLADYRSGKRVSTTMQPMVADLGVDDFAALGRYFASRPTSKHEVADPGLAQVGAFVYARGNPYSGVAACAGCHGDNGHGTELLPRLAGQHAQYVEKQLREFNSRARTNDNAIMHAVASKLTELEMKAVSAFISGME
jgi:cytochrome c553